MSNQPTSTVAKKSRRKKILHWLNNTIGSTNTSANQSNSSVSTAPVARNPGPGSHSESVELAAPAGEGNYYPGYLFGQLTPAPGSTAPLQGAGPPSLNIPDPSSPVTGQEPAANSHRTATAKEGFGVASRFLQTLLKRVPECVDTNPVKAAFSIARVVVEIKNAVGDNKDELVQHLEQVANRLLAVERAIAIGLPKAAEQEMEKLKQTLQEEMGKLKGLADKSLAIRILDHEEEKMRILRIFQRVNDATTTFQFEMANSIQETANTIQKDIKNAALERLCHSKMADYRTVLEHPTLKREECTVGTRVKIIGDITNWANNRSSASPRVFWLTGQAGSGKSTIAYTVAKQFGKDSNADQHTVLGGNFFCSRQYQETQGRTRIIPTIVYQLARKCELYANALHVADKFDAVNHDIATQMKDLLIGPWQQSVATDHPESFLYLIIIDALDEIQGNGGSAFLRELLNAVDAYKLQGLKFLVTSRSDPELVTLCEGFTSEAVCRLQDVPIEETKSDIVIYLGTKLPMLASSLELAELGKRADGLFIYAATAVTYLTQRARITTREQAEMLKDLLTRSHKSSSASKATFLIDELYRHIMYNVFSELEEKFLIRRLQILYTFLCTAERTSTSITAALIPDCDDETAQAVLDDLHAVLYTRDGRVFWHHASFPDFIFDRARSNFRIGEENFECWCDESAHHSLLSESCFRIMKSGLRFNMGNITSSFLMDCDHAVELSEQVNQNITAALRYSCSYWAHHLPLVPSSVICCCISDFLQIRVLFWIEALNLLKLHNQCTPMLQCARQWVLKCNNGYLELAQDIGEAANFATYYTGSPAVESTPHLYISALATWSQKSSLYQDWKRQFSHLPIFIPTVSSRLPLMTIKTGWITSSIAFSSNGAWIAFGSDVNSIHMWDASTGVQLKVLNGHTSFITSVAFSSDGAQIVSGSYDLSVCVWDVSTGVQLKVLNGHTEGVISVAFSSDGAQIVSGSDDNSVRVWDVSMGVQLRVLNGHTDRVSSVAFSSDDAQIVSGSYDKSVCVWDVSTGVQLEVLNGHTDRVTSVAFSSDGAQIVSGSHDKSVCVWDVSTGVQLEVLNGHTDGVSSVAFSSNGAQIVSGSYDNSVRVWDALKGVQLEVLNGHTDGVTSIAFSSNGARIVSSSLDFSVCVWDVSTGMQLEVLNGHTDRVSSVAFSSDGAQIVSGSSDDSVCVWDASTGVQLKVLNGHTDRVSSVAFSSNGAQIVSGSFDNSVRVWDASTGVQLDILNGHADRVTSVAFSSDGAQIVSGSYDKSVRVWDTITGVQLELLTGHAGGISSVAFSSDSAWIVSGSYDLSVRMWDALTGVQLDVLNGHTDYVTSVAFSSDGAQIVSGSYDKSVRVWDALTGVQLEVLTGHADGISSVAFLSDGACIVSGSYDNSVCVWDVLTGVQLEVLNGHTKGVTSVAFASNGARIVSGSDDKSVRMWDLLKPVTLNHSPNSLTIAHECHSWLLSSRQWVVSSLTGNHLMWVPVAEILHPFNTLIISCSGSATVDFQHSMIGSDWVHCYAP